MDDMTVLPEVKDDYIWDLKDYWELHYLKLKERIEQAIKYEDEILTELLNNHVTLADPCNIQMSRLTIERHDSCKNILEKLLK